MSVEIWLDVNVLIVSVLMEVICVVERVLMLFSDSVLVCIDDSMMSWFVVNVVICVVDSVDI